MKPLNARQLEVLNELHFLNHSSRHPMAWARPMDVGGSSGSHHSATLTSLTSRGLAQSKQRGAPEPLPGINGQAPRHLRGAKAYRITPEGIALHLKGRPA